MVCIEVGIASPKSTALNSFDSDNLITIIVVIIELQTKLANYLINVFRITIYNADKIKSGYSSGFLWLLVMF